MVSSYIYEIRDHAHSAYAQKSSKLDTSSPLVRNRTHLAWPPFIRSAFHIFCSPYPPLPPKKFVFRFKFLAFLISWLFWFLLDILKIINGTIYTILYFFFFCFFFLRVRTQPLKPPSPSPSPFTQSYVDDPSSKTYVKYYDYDKIKT